MKIALVSPYDVAHPGGVVSHICALDRQLVRRGYDVRVIAPAARNIDQFGDRFIRIGRPLPIPSSESVIRVPVSLRLGPTIKSTFLRERFDIVHLHEPFMPMLCSAIMRFSDAVNVGTFHAAQGKPGYNWGRPVSTWMIRSRLKRLHGRIAVSEAAREFASRVVPGPYETIPNGIDLEAFSEDVAPIPRFMDGKLNILFLSRLEFRKGLNYLLNAYLLLKPEFPQSRLIVAGPGTRLRKRYERWIENTGLQDVVFVGAVTEEEKPRYYKTADIFSVPATGRESFGVILLEAMALRKPIVATNISGYCNVVTDGEDGLLVPPRDYVQLAGALRRMMADESLRRRMGDAGRAKAQRYSWETVSQRIIDHYMAAIERARAATP